MVSSEAIIPCGPYFSFSAAAETASGGAGAIPAAGPAQAVLEGAWGACGRYCCCAAAAETDLEVLAADAAQNAEKHTKRIREFHK
jgi:hypothetical protein